MSEPDEDLPEHDHAETVVGGGSGAGVTDPVADEDEEGGGDDGGLGATFVQSPYHEGGDRAEGKEERRAQPVYGRGRDVEILSGGCGDGREGEPLLYLNSAIVVFHI